MHGGFALQDRPLYAEWLAPHFGFGGYPVYALTKHAVIGFVRSVAPQLATHRDGDEYHLTFEGDYNDGASWSPEGDLIAYTVMEKRTGWGTEYADDIRNGEWEYAVFTADGRPNPKGNANNKACFTCHLPHAKQDFVISLAKLNNTFPGTQTLVKGKKGDATSDVNIASFAFMPAKISAMAGKALTFFNSDDTPHQISVSGGPRTDVFLRGQKASLTIDKPGEYNYICGLHPSMKGVIVVK